ncbi:MAG: divalent-cation tolerance protein CutA [Acidimicrobiales bacterium]
MPTDDDDPCEVRITASSLDWLVDHTRQLVGDRLVACGQHETTIRSIYRWQGAIEDDTEARVALHTTHRCVPEIIRRTQAAHSDDVPGIIVLPIVDGNPDYLQWLREQTQQAADEP